MRCSTVAAKESNDLLCKRSFNPDLPGVMVRRIEILRYLHCVILRPNVVQYALQRGSFTPHIISVRFGQS